MSSLILNLATRRAVVNFMLLLLFVEEKNLPVKK
jgi:hypothetical protein